MVLQLHGRRLDQSAVTPTRWATMVEGRIARFCCSGDRELTVHLCSIPTRRELVKEAARNPTNSELKETQQEQQQWSWKNCPLSHGALVRPIVSDSAGKLYNKDVVLQFLLPTATSAEKADGEAILQGRVKSLRDVVQVKFEVDDDEDEDRQGKGGAGAAEHENWVCPITRKRLGPNVKSSYIVPCGHAFSDSAIKEVSGGSCLQVSRTPLAVMSRHAK